jgi:DNA-directed RNA polymerase specialized sigma subunit
MDPSVQGFPPPTATSEDLVAANLGLARQAAWRFHRKTGQPYDDLEAVAYVGLIRGCRRYDPERVNPGNGKAYAISTVVCPFITGEILHWFRDRGHTIKFPSRWREQWGKVQRLMADPNVSAEQVAERAGMSTEEISEMLGAMTGVSCLDDLHGADACDMPELEIDRLAPLQALVQQAWANLHQADRGLLLSWWAQPRRLAYPTGPVLQFHGRVKALLQGRRLSEVMQLGLGLQVPTVAVEPKVRARRTRRELDAAVVQLGLIAAPCSVSASAAVVSQSKR